MAQRRRPDPRTAQGRTPAAGTFDRPARRRPACPARQGPAVSRDPVPLSNTPWWLPEVTLGGGDGLTRQRCNPYGHETGGPKHLEGGVYSPEHEPYTWYCEAVADARYRAECVHGHRGQQMWLCNGHRMMLAKRAMGVCPPCAWPPKALRLHEQMNAIRYGAAVMDE